jgi:sugar O-acyltransferase (sialic acid O-acetyltransferase NeuD family)
MAAVETAAQAPRPDRVVSPRRLVVLGAGEHGRVVVDAARTRPEAWQPVWFTAPAAEGGGPAARFGADTGLDWRGDDAALAAELGSADPAGRPALVVGFGASPAGRAAAVARFEADTDWATIVHGSAWVSPSARIEPGAVVLAGAVVNAGALIGRHAIVNSGAVVEHDVVVGAFAHVAPGAILGGGAVIGEAAQIGLAAAIRDHVTVGARATVGMGAVVVADVPPGAVVVGNPARPMARDADG